MKSLTNHSSLHITLEYLNQRVLLAENFINDKNLQKTALWVDIKEGIFLFYETLHRHFKTEKDFISLRRDVDYYGYTYRLFLRVKSCVDILISYEKENSSELQHLQTVNKYVNRIIGYMDNFIDLTNKQTYSTNQQNSKHTEYNCISNQEFNDLWAQSEE